MSAVRIAALLTVAACGPGDAGGGSWSLALTPQTHPNQAPFAATPDARLLLRRTSGDLVVPLRPVVEGGSATADGLPSADALTDLYAIGLAIQAVGGDDASWDPTLLQAYGEVPLDPPRAGDLLTAHALVSRVDAIGDLGALKPVQERFLRGVAVVPPGEVYLFGGGTSLSEVTADVYALDDLDAGSPWSFDAIGTLPDDGDDLPARLGLTATTVVRDGAPRVFVAGGRDTWFSAIRNSPDWWLFNPSTRSFEAHGSLLEGRAEHQALVLQTGEVLLYGGYTDTIVGAELWAPETGTSFLTSLAPARSGYAAAAIGDAGVLACGGFDLVEGATIDAVLSRRCQILDLLGHVRDVAPLPVPLARPTLIALSANEVLCAGGFSFEGQDSASAPYPATDQAWRYQLDTDTWTPVASLREARSSHAAIALAGGRALIVGGIAQDSPLTTPRDAVGCPEVYDPISETFSLLADQCGTWGAGAYPSIGAHPDVGAVLLEGYTIAEDPQDAVGFLGVGPNLSRPD